MSRTQSMHEPPTSPVQSRPTKMLSLDSSKPPALPEKRKSGIPAPSGRNVNNNIDIKVTRTPSLRTDRTIERRDDIRRSSFLLPKKSVDGVNEGLLSPKLFGRKNLLEGLKGLNRSKSKDETMKHTESSPVKKDDESLTEVFKSEPGDMNNQEHQEADGPKGWSFKLNRRPSETKPDIPNSKRLSSHEVRSPKLSDSKLEPPPRKSSQCKSPDPGQKVIRKPSMSERPLFDDPAKKPPRPNKAKSPVPSVQSPVRVRRENWVKSKQTKIIPP